MRLLEWEDTISGRNALMIRYVVFLMYATSLVMHGLLTGRAEAPAREWEYGLEMTEIPANYEQYLPPQVILVPMSVPSNYNALAYQHHTSITKVSSPQYKLVSQATANAEGFMELDGYLLVAMGQYYGKVGDKLRITILVQGKEVVVKAQLGDMKAKPHTTNGYKVGLDGSIIEFIVNKQVFKSSALAQYRGTITKIEKEVLK